MLMITGARSWEHEQWQGSYYPKEIAQDWHLSFYSREFETALAPSSLWKDCTIEEIKEFCSDVDETYPLIFEKNPEETDEKIISLQESMNEFVPNWVNFDGDTWQKEEPNYHIKQADILHSSNLKPDAAVFKVSSSEALPALTLKEIMLFLKKEFKQYEVIYCYFDGELVAIDTLNTVQTLRKMIGVNF